MNLVIRIDDTHMPFVRQQLGLRGPAARLDFEGFPALLPAEVIGVAEESLSSPDADSPLYYVTPVEGM